MSDTVIERDNDPQIPPDPNDVKQTLAEPAPAPAVQETSAPETKLRPRKGEEIWEMLVQGTVWLTVTTTNRLNQVVEESRSIGPNKQGHQFRVNVLDREYMQGRAQDPTSDPFVNGMLRRLVAAPDEEFDDFEQGQDAISAGELSDILDLSEADFTTQIQRLGERPARRLRDMAEAMNAGFRYIELLDDMIRERWSPAASQVAIEKADEKGYRGIPLS